MMRIIKIGKNPKKRIAKKKIKRAKKARKIMRKKSRIARIKKNPAPHKRIETMIVGFIGEGKKRSHRRMKRMYYTGRGFMRDRKHAKIFPGDAAKLEAKRIVNSLPYQIEHIAVERV